jgi:hypothetical protein
MSLRSPSEHAGVPGRPNASSDGDDATRHFVRSQALGIQLLRPTRLPRCLSERLRTLPEGVGRWPSKLPNAFGITGSAFLVQRASMPQPGRPDVRCDRSNVDAGSAATAASSSMPNTTTGLTHNDVVQRREPKGRSPPVSVRCTTG